MDELPAESLVLGRAATSTAAAPTFMGPETGFVKDNFSTDPGMGDGFVAGMVWGMIQAHYIYHALYF